MFKGLNSVLVVDDNRTFAMYLSLLLKRMGFGVITVSNGFDALKIARALHPDIILLDISMPDMDGYTVLRHLKDNDETASIAVVMSTAEGNTNTAEECRRLGCNGYITKPVTPGRLHEVIQECVISAGGIRRQAPRTSLNKKVTIICGDKATTHYAISLSEGGMFLRKRDPLPVGSEIIVAIPLNNGFPLNLKGTVIYNKDIYQETFSTDPGIAIQFSPMSEVEGKLLRTYITGLLTSDLLDEQEEEVLRMDC